MTYSVRLMTRSDLVQVNEIDREAFPTQWPPPNYRNELQNQMARYMVVCDDAMTWTEPAVKSGDGPGLLARIGRRLGWRTGPERPAATASEYIVGFVGIWVLADEAHITNIAVRQQYQRRGMGELLMITALAMAREMRASIMTLEVRASNYNAQNLYRKYGFAEAGVRRGYYTDNREDGIIMTTEDINSASYQVRLQGLKESLNDRCGPLPLDANLPSVHPGVH